MNNEIEEYMARVEMERLDYDRFFMRANRNDEEIPLEEPEAPLEGREWDSLDEMLASCHGEPMTWQEWDDQQDDELDI